MKKILTILVIFILCATWSIAQDCTIGTTVGSTCTFTSDGTLTIPAGVALTIDVKAWGAGGSSNQGGGSDLSRAGGGGGAYYTNTYSVAPGTFSITVGAPMLSNNPGGSSTFNFDGNDVTVGGGGFGGNSGASGGTVTNAGTGTVVDGGNGGNRTNGSTNDAGGGGGGSGPGNSAGGNASGSTGGLAGTSGSPGAAGGAGGDAGGAGNVGGFPGGGAGGKGDGSGGQTTFSSGGSGQVIVEVTAVLPVDLVSFNAKAKDDRILLEWQTKSELNNRGFEIQKSKDGRAWDILEFVEGKGTIYALNTYYSQDRSPIQGSNYYRLKQLDFDGNFEYSNIVFVNFNHQINKVGIFPNPVKDQLTLVNAEGKATLYNVLGQPVKSMVIVDSESIIELAGLLNGQYFLQVLQEDGTIVTKQFSIMN